MDGFFTLSQIPITLTAMLITGLAGIVKGMVGFAMPLVMISGLTLLFPPETALAALILPTLVSNIFQAMRQGQKAARQATYQFRVFLIAGGVAMIFAAQAIQHIPSQKLLLFIGVPILVFVTLQLIGVRFHLSRQNPLLEGAIGVFTGVIGALSGVWGPPTVAYLTALGIKKHEQLRVQGVIYGLASVALLVGHVWSGLFSWGNAVFSAVLIPPALAGMWLGGKIADRIDQHSFRRATLIVLVISALNLLRRAFIVN